METQKTGSGFLSVGESFYFGIRSILFVGITIVLLTSFSLLMLLGVPNFVLENIGEDSVLWGAFYAMESLSMPGHINICVQRIIGAVGMTMVFPILFLLCRRWKRLKIAFLSVASFQLAFLIVLHLACGPGLPLLVPFCALYHPNLSLNVIFCLLCLGYMRCREKDASDEYLTKNPGERSELRFLRRGALVFAVLVALSLAILLYWLTWVVLFVVFDRSAAIQVFADVGLSPQHSYIVLLFVALGVLGLIGSGIVLVCFSLAKAYAARVALAATFVISVVPVLALLPMGFSSLAAYVLPYFFNLCANAFCSAGFLIAMRTKKTGQRARGEKS